jgi:Mor family transcriptional regulator
MRKTEATEMLYHAADALVELAEELMPGRFTAEEREMLRHEAAWRLVCAIGGMQVYLPTPANIESAAIEESILREFNGRNINELAVRYGISVIHAYRILKKARMTARRSEELPHAQANSADQHEAFKRADLPGLSSQEPKDWPPARHP